MIPVPPLVACLENPERGNLPWSKWEIIDAVGFRVCGGMEKYEAQWMVARVNESERLRTGMVMIAAVAKGIVEEIALRALRWAWVEWGQQVMVDKKGVAYTVKNNQRKK